MQTYNLIHRSDLLHRDAGTFYHHYYEDADRVFSVFDSFCWAAQLMLEEALDSAKMFYRHQIPVLHRDLSFPVTVTEEDYLNGQYRLFSYGDAGMKYGQGRYYGLPDNDVAGAVKLPDGVVDADLCCDLPADPSVILLKNSGFEIKNGYLIFSRNIFDCFLTEGTAPNRTCTFWLRSAYSDRQYLQNRLGVLTRTNGESTENYAAFCNQIIDSVIEGTSAVRLTQIICRLFDVPCSEEDETVEAVEQQKDIQCLVTDKRVYFAPPAASFLYQAGESVPAGTILTDAVSVICRKKLPKGMPLFLERRFLGSEYLSGLFFPNEETRVTYNASLTEAAFPVIGRKEDIDRFWKTFHERVLDRKLLNTVSLGGWLNPAEFIYENVLYPRLRLYQVNLNKTGTGRLPMPNTRILRSLLPPGVLFSLQMSMPSVPPPDNRFPLSGKALHPGIGMRRVSCVLPLEVVKPTIRAC